MLALGARVIGPGLALDIVDAWLNAQFMGKQQVARIEKIAKKEAQEL